MSLVLVMAPQNQNSWACTKILISISRRALRLVNRSLSWVITREYYSLSTSFSDWRQLKSSQGRARSETRKTVSGLRFKEALTLWVIWMQDPGMITSLNSAHKSLSWLTLVPVNRAPRMKERLSPLEEGPCYMANVCTVNLSPQGPAAIYQSDCILGKGK